jgi:hypothetical protein
MPILKHKDTGKRIYFIHIPRTAGRFVGGNLTMNGFELVGDNNKFVDGVEIVHFHRKLYEKHLRVRGIPHFTIVRNPIDRFRSSFFNLKFMPGCGDGQVTNISAIMNDMDSLVNDIRTYNWYRPMVDFVTKKTHVWRFEDGFGNDFFSWLSGVVGIDVNLKNTSYEHIGFGINDMTFSNTQDLPDEVIDHVTKFYHNDIEQFYPELK